MDKLEEIARHSQGTVRTRWGLVDLTLVLMRLDADGMDANANTIVTFFMQFEKERRFVGNKLADLQTRLVNITLELDAQSGEVPEVVSLEFPEISSSMLTYYLAFAREGGYPGECPNEVRDNVSTLSKPFGTDRGIVTNEGGRLSLG